MPPEQENTDFKGDSLSRVSRENPFRVPDDYFRQLPAAIAGRAGQERILRPVGDGRRPFRTYAAAACVAVVMLLAGIYASVLRGPAHDPATLTYEQVSNSVYFHDLDIFLLMDEVARQGPGNGDSDEGYIEDYLLDHSADISDYYIEQL